MWVCPRMWVSLLFMGVPSSEFSNLPGGLFSKIWGFWSVCGYMLQSLKSVVFLWVVWSFCAGCEISNLFVGAYPRISAPLSVWWCMSHGVRALNYLWCLNSLICWWLHVQVVRSVISVSLCPRMWTPLSVCWVMSDGVKCLVCSLLSESVWSLWPMWGYSSRIWVAHLFAFTMP